VPRAIAEQQSALAVSAALVLVASAALVGFLISRLRPGHRRGILLQAIAAGQATVLVIE
jgi:hypothetical protein